jgi:hypothetical protein
MKVRKKSKKPIESLFETAKYFHIPKIPA